jgi:hypothetical protein
MRYASAGEKRDVNGGLYGSEDEKSISRGYDHFGRPSCSCCRCNPRRPTPRLADLNIENTIRRYCRVRRLAWGRPSFLRLGSTRR